MPNLTADELQAIDLACMTLLEMARRGRKKQTDYIEIDNDPAGAEWMAPAIRKMDEARVTLRSLLAKHKETTDAND
jgi:hypothetical protein